MVTIKNWNQFCLECDAPMGLGHSFRSCIPGVCPAGCDPTRCHAIPCDEHCGEPQKTHGLVGIYCDDCA